MKIAEFETLVENAAETGHSPWTDAAVESGLMREVDTRDPRLAYRGKTLLTAHTEIETDTWQSGLNNNVLVLGCSGGGKTRHHVKPNLLQASGSYIVLDCKGSLYREVGPYLAEAGYVVDQLDFSTMGGTVGYNPLANVRFVDGEPLQQDIIAIASAICPIEDHESDPFWPQAAANYLCAYITYVLEALPSTEWHMGSVMQVFEAACSGRVDRMFAQLDADDPSAFAPALYRRTRVTCGAEKMHSSILGILAANLMPFGFPEATNAYRRARQVDFRSFGREKRALFVTINDMDRSLDRLTSMFIRQAFCALCDSADHDYPNHRLPVPVRFVLDDFANLNLPHIDDVLAVIRSREISCTIICQTISQLEARYGTPAANSIIGNCDAQLVLAFQDERTAQYFATRANKPASALLETPAGMWWVFVRGQRGRMEQAYRLEDHPRYPELVACLGRAETEAAFGTPDEWEFEEFFDFDEPDEPFSPCPAA
ncbi:VirD4-like conjugal transfer protein, CD1115 family [Slackia isoflavoniconvertens]|uniref:VirD4-like conjugal transfer protein, CD1115 family n=1 Tax=Slackia isoflavoniconvertens TaxID=572010 RepID=UPI003F9C0B8C